MNTNTALSFLCLILAAASPSCFAADKTTAPTTAPNILVIMTDDESAFERSLYGWSELATPNLDRIAHEGVTFRNAYSSAPSCAPARASFLTGREFWQLKQGAFIQAFLPKEFPVLPQILKDHGYHVARIGKVWGPVGAQLDLGHTPSESGGPEKPIVYLENPKPAMSDRDYAASFSAFLDEIENDSAPFFYWAGIYEPHKGWAHDNYLRLEAEYGMSTEDIQLPPTTEDTEKNRRLRANYLYEILYADEQVGRLLDALEQRGLKDNTIVLFTGDNGTPMERGKASAYNAGVHVPFAIRWPERVPSGREVTDFIDFSDVAPTLLSAVNIPIPQSMTGHSFLDTLESSESGRIDTQRDFIVTGLEWHGEMPPESLSSRALRNDQYSLVLHYPEPSDTISKAPSAPSRIELFDRKEDPWEQSPITNQTVQTKLLDQLRRYGIASGDPRFTGDMALFNKTRTYVQKRKALGYTKTHQLPFPEETE